MPVGSNHDVGLLSLRHELHSHRLFYFLLGLEGDSFAVASPELDRHFFADGTMSIKLDPMFLVSHVGFSFCGCSEPGNCGILQNTTRRNYATGSAMSSTLYYNGLEI